MILNKKDRRRRRIRLFQKEKIAEVVQESKKIPREKTREENATSLQDRKRTSRRIYSRRE